MAGRALEIYIHIPFCVRKCAYCDFLSGPADEAQKERYLEALLREIESFSDEGRYEVCTIFFGGGTPSVLPAAWILRMMQALREKFEILPEAEITIECNPGTADQEKLAAYRRAGINRISFGLQSAENAELSLLGRIHTWETFLETYAAARAAGFANINIDLMSALPGQSVQSWERTLQKVAALQPEHISAYSLIIEEGTPFYERYHEEDERRARGGLPEVLPSEEEERDMYERTEALLAEAGMTRYEISNYARCGFECRHNTGYWTGVEYAGFGLGASSLLNHVRYKNTEEMNRYLQCFAAGQETPGDCREREELSVQDEMEEFMFLGLRMMNGVSEAEFERRFGRSMDDVYSGVLETLAAQRLIGQKEGRVFLTKEGISLSNVVMAEFLL